MKKIFVSLFLLLGMQNLNAESVRCGDMETVCEDVTIPMKVNSASGFFSTAQNATVMLTSCNENGMHTLMNISFIDMAGIPQSIDLIINTELDSSGENSCQTISGHLSTEGGMSYNLNLVKGNDTCSEHATGWTANLSAHMGWCGTPSSHMTLSE